MTESTTLLAVSPPTSSGEVPDPPPSELTAGEQESVRELVCAARASGTALTGPGGLLKQLTKMVVEAALDEEMSEHLGYDKGRPSVVTGVTPATGNTDRVLEEMTAWWLGRWRRCTRRCSSTR